MERIAFRSTWKHAVLEYQIKEIDTNPDLTRSAITARAVDAAENVDDWAKVREELSQLVRMDIPIAVSMQAKLDEKCMERLQTVRKKMFEDLKAVMPDFKRLQTPYLIQLLWVNYLRQLKNKTMLVGNKLAEDLSGPDMVKRLVQILLLNREADKEIITKIKSILIEWKE